MGNNEAILYVQRAAETLLERNIIKGIEPSEEKGRISLFGSVKVRRYY